MQAKLLVPFIIAATLHAQSSAPVRHSARTPQTSEGTDSDAAMRKLVEAAATGFANLRGDWHGPGNRWESTFKPPGALFCNVDWRKRDVNNTGSLYCDMGEHYTYLSASEAMNRFGAPVKRVLPTWRGVVDSDGKHPDFSDSDVLIFLAPTLQGEKGPAVSFKRLKAKGDDFMVIMFFNTVLDDDALVSKYGGPPKSDEESQLYDFGRLANDLIQASSRSWMMNRYTPDSATVLSTGANENGQVTQVRARYEFTGMNGPSAGSVIVTISDGSPQCLYFFDFPNVCRPADPDIASAFGNNRYLKH